MNYKIYAVENIGGIGFELNSDGVIISHEEKIIDLDNQFYVEIWEGNRLIAYEPFKEFYRAKEWAEEYIETEKTVKVDINV